MQLFFIVPNAATQEIVHKEFKLENINKVVIIIVHWPNVLVIVIRRGIRCGISLSYYKWWITLIQLNSSVESVFQLKESCWRIAALPPGILFSFQLLMRNHWPLAPIFINQLSCWGTTDHMFIPPKLFFRSQTVEARELGNPFQLLLKQRLYYYYFADLDIIFGKFFNFVDNTSNHNEMFQSGWFLQPTRD